jgi:Protein of unknown function (DUF2800)
MGAHSSIVGGSNAGRLLACPGSHQALMAMPPSADIDSEYASEGTMAHEVMARILGQRICLNHSDLPALARALIGQSFNERTFTQEHYDNLIEPALAHLFELELMYGGGFSIVCVEQRVRFPGVPGAFGTLDLILDSPTHVLHVDWKFGQGIGIRAVYSDDDGERVNPQLMFYLCAAKATLPGLYGRRRFVVAIVQPRGVEPLTHTIVLPSEIKQFKEDVHQAVLIAMSRNPPRARGEHCRFAACKTQCPLWTGPLLDLTGLPEHTVPAPSATPEYGEYLARAKLLVDLAAEFKITLDAQLHAYLTAGGLVPGWRLKAKSTKRAWADEDTVVNTLTKLGFANVDIWQKKLVTFASADATARKLRVKIPEALRVAPATNETTICPTDDPAPIAEPHRLIEDFVASLRLLQHKQET